MCGILAWLQEGNHSTLGTVPLTGFRIKHRGPDQTFSGTVARWAYFTFHRLKINGLTKGMQPFYQKDWTFMVNGEIYNCKDLVAAHLLETTTDSDCEVVGRLLDMFSPQTVFSMLDGVFACVAVHRKRVAVVARDAFGVRSLYYGRTKNGLIGFASEAKALHGVCELVHPFPPGEVWVIDLKQGLRSTRRLRHHIGFDTHKLYPPLYTDDEAAMQMVRSLLIAAVRKRMMVERRGAIGCFLSGGLDSSLVAALVAKECENPKDIHTFSIGMENSPDVRFARSVSEFIGTTHHEIITTPKVLLDAIPNAIAQMETWDTTTVRAGTPMFVLSEYIQTQTDIRVCFSGEGADELSGSYMYFKNCPTGPEGDGVFQVECVRLCKDLSFFDVLRCDKTTSGHGLEVRVPFLDLEFSKNYLRVAPNLRRPREGIEKYLLRKAFEPLHLLPKEVLWRTKEAFSDGVSENGNKSWHHIIQQHVNGFDPRSVPDSDKEATWYRHLFNNFYPGCEQLIPYCWLPRWCGENVSDPSARVLQVYSD